MHDELSGLGRVQAGLLQMGRLTKGILQGVKLESMGLGVLHIWNYPRDWHGANSRCQVVWLVPRKQTVPQTINVNGDCYVFWTGDVYRRLGLFEEVSSILTCVANGEELRFLASAR